MSSFTSTVVVFLLSTIMTAQHDFLWTINVTFNHKFETKKKILLVTYSIKTRHSAIQFFQKRQICRVIHRVLVCECACVRHTRACGNPGAKEVRSFMNLCVRMCVRSGFFRCVTRVRSHLKFFHKIMKKILKTKGFLRWSRILTFTWIKSSQEF